jgi:hypothetical protein
MKQGAFLLALLPLACAGPGTIGTTQEDDLASLRSEVVALRDQVNKLANRVDHLVANLEEGEFTQMTIDKVLWRNSLNFSPPLAPDTDNVRLLCHVAEWDGFGRMMRFTRLADSVFYLEAQGHPPVKASMAQGGLSSFDGSTRFTSLRASRPLTPGVEYTLRPRNNTEGYKWVVADDVRIIAIEGGF